MVMLQKFFKPSPYNKNNLPQHLQNISEHDACVFVLWASKEKLKSAECLTELEALLLQQFGNLSVSAISFWIRAPEINNFSLKDRQSGGAGNAIVAMIRARDLGDEHAEHLLNTFKQSGYEAQALKAKNSVPFDAMQSTSSGRHSSGLVSVSFFKAKKGLSKEQFWDYWFNAHTPFALDIHPLCKYERNRVLSSFDGKEPIFEPPVFDAIVPLHLDKDEDLKFSKFFTHDGRSAFANALRILNDVKQFIDMKGIETVAMREIVVS